MKLSDGREIADCCGKRSTARKDLGEEQGWCSGESICLPLMWPRFDSQSRHYMWDEFVVGSLLAPRGFSPGTPVFPSPQKPTLPNSNSIRNARTCSVGKQIPFLLGEEGRRTFTSRLSGAIFPFVNKRCHFGFSVLSLLFANEEKKNLGLDLQSTSLRIKKKKLRKKPYKN